MFYWWIVSARCFLWESARRFSLQGIKWRCVWDQRSGSASVLWSKFCFGYICDVNVFVCLFVCKKQFQKQNNKLTETGSHVLKVYLKEYSFDPVFIVAYIQCF